MAYFEGEIPTVVSGNNSNGFGNGFSDGWWGIILIALLFGWGRGGYGFGGGNGGNGEVVGYELGKMATQADNANYRAIHEELVANKIEAKNERIAALTQQVNALQLAASQQAQNAYIAANQEAQTAELIRRLGKDCPVPAYVVPNPNCCYGNPLGVSYNQGNCSFSTIQ